MLLGVVLYLACVGPRGQKRSPKKRNVDAVEESNGESRMRKTLLALLGSSLLVSLTTVRADQTLADATQNFGPAHPAGSRGSSRSVEQASATTPRSSTGDRQPQQQSPPPLKQRQSPLRRCRRQWQAATPLQPTPAPVVNSGVGNGCGQFGSRPNGPGRDHPPPGVAVPGPRPD